MERNKTVAETSAGVQKGGGLNEAGNNHKENIQILEPWPEQTSGVEPPPFLLKIYDIVDDPNTNSIISWGSNNPSFIIFDQLKFTSEILPKHFRHGNFSSFIYQLNNYGFRKSSWNKIEYENKWFQAGKKHWLKYMKRRNQTSQPEMTSHEESSTSPNDSKMEIVEEIEFIKGGQNTMKEDIEQLRKRRDGLADKFAAFQENIKLADSKHEEIIIPLVIKKLSENVSKRRGNGSTDSIKRRKLTISGFIDSENPDITEHNAEDVYVQIGNKKHQIQKDLNEIQTEAQILSLPDDSGTSNQDDQVDAFPRSAENCAYWQKILEDDFIHEHHEPVFEENNHIKLEDLMACDTPMQDENSVTYPRS